MTLDKDRLISIVNVLGVAVRLDRESGIYNENNDYFDFKDVVGDFINVKSLKGWESDEKI